MNWSNAIKEYDLFLKIEKGGSNHTYMAYMRDIGRYRIYMEEITEIDSPLKVTLEDLRVFTEALIRDYFLSERSLARNLSALRSFHGFLIIEGLTEDDPTDLLENPKFAHKLPVVLSIEEIERMLESLELTKAHEIRNYAIIELLYSSGLRVSELIGLEMNRIYLEEGFIQVMGKGYKERLVPLGEMAKEAFLTYVKEVRSQQKIAVGHEGYAFLNRRGKKLTRIMIFHIVKDLCVRAEITKNVSPHTFRHSFATHMIEGGADLRAVQEMMGHESITTTEIYLHVDRSYLQEVHALYHPRK